MKKIIYSAFIGFVLAFGGTSCQDVLNQAPTDQYTDAQVWNDEFLLESHLAQLYAMTSVMVQDAGCISNMGSPLNVTFGSNWSENLGLCVQGEGPIHMTTIADEAKYSQRGAQSNLHGLKMNGIQSNSNYLRWWENAYYLNRQLNHFIANISNSPLTNADLKKAEARFLRAYNYFSLVKRYGGVPLITEVIAIDAPDEEMFPKRNTEQEVWDFVIKECTEIAEILEDYPAAGHAGKYAALTLLSRAALYAGSVAKYGTVALDGLNGVPADKADYYFDLSFKASERIIKESKYDLYEGNPDKVQNLKDIFLVKGNCEAIMVKQHTGLSGDGQGAYSLWSWDICNSPKPNAWSVGWYSQPYYDLVEKFENTDGTSGKIDHATLTSKAWTMEELFGKKDPRFHAWFWTNGTAWPQALGGEVFGDNHISMYRYIYDENYNDGPADNPHLFFNEEKPVYNDDIRCYGDQIYEIRNINRTGFGVMKYLDPSDIAKTNMDWFMASTTDYLIFRFAEVLLNHAEAAVELGKHGDAKDAINRIRSRAGIKELTSVTMDDVRHEREVELCFENHRYWDLRRWRTAVETLDGKKHYGIDYALDYASYKVGTPKFRIIIDDMVDDDEKTATFPEKNYYLPIGSGTIAANTNLIPNPGY